jgi:hypothetical protein
MRFPQVRFTVRRLMVVVAVSAVVASVPATIRRSKERRIIAHWHRVVRNQASITGAEREAGPVDAAELVRLNQKFNDYHNIMADKYEWGSRYPWLPVASDRANAVTGDLERGYLWFNLHCWFGSVGMQDLSWGEPKSGRCPALHRLR